MKFACFLSATLFFISKLFSQQPVKYFTSVDFSHVVVTDHFWKPKIDLVATKSLEACIYQTEIDTSRIHNFINAAKHSGKFIGIFYDDSDGLITSWEQVKLIAKSFQLIAY